QRHDRVGAAFVYAAVDRDDPGADFLFRAMRDVGNDFRLWCGQQAIAASDFLLGLDDPDAGWLAGFDQPGRAQEKRLMGDDGTGLGVLQRLAGTEDVPLFDAGIGNAGNEGFVTVADHHAVFLGGDDARLGPVGARLDDQWLRDKGIDDVRRNARDDLLDRFAINLRLQLAAAAAADSLAQAQARAAVGGVEEDDVAGINEVRVLDLVAVHAPDFRPAPGLLQEFPGDAPQRV